MLCIKVPIQESGCISTLSPKPLNPLNPKPLNPKPLNPKPLNPKPGHQFLFWAAGEAYDWSLGRTEVQGGVGGILGMGKEDVGFGGVCNIKQADDPWQGKL